MTADLAREARTIAQALAGKPMPTVNGQHLSDLLTRLAAALDGAPTAQPVKSYVQEVPEHCDRIVWRGSYYGLPLKRFCFDMSKAPLVGQEDSCRVVLTDGRTAAVCYAEDGEWLVHWDGSTFHQPSGWLLLPPFSREAAALPAPTPAPEPGVTSCPECAARAKDILPLVYQIVHEAWHSLDDSEEWSPTEFLITAEHYKELSDLFDKLSDLLDGTDDTTLGWEKPLGDLLAALKAAPIPVEAEIIERCAQVAENVKGGFTANIRTSPDEQESIRDPDGPWVLNSDVAKAIRALTAAEKGR